MVSDRGERRTPDAPVRVLAGVGCYPEAEGLEVVLLSRSVEILVWKPERRRVRRLCSHLPALSMTWMGMEAADSSGRWTMRNSMGTAKVARKN